MAKGKAATDGGMPAELRLPSGRVLKFDPQSSQALADRVHILKHARIIPGYSDLAKAAGVTFGKIKSDKGYEQRLSRWLNNPVDELDLLRHDNYILLVTHIMNLYPYMADYIDIPIISILNNPIYHSMAPILDCQGRGPAKGMLINSLQGKYVIYRPAMRRDGYGYVGFMSINYENNSESFHTREIYSANHEDGSDEHWDIKGAMFPINKTNHIIISVDNQDSSIQVKYIDYVGLSFDKVTYFAGWVSDADRYIYYTAPIYFRRVDDFEGENLKFMPIAEMPRAVRTWFAESTQAQLVKRGSNIWVQK